MNTARMPSLFLGHGTPMNAIEENRYSALWPTLGEKLPRPRAIVVISAHWYIRGTWVTAMPHPKTIHDFYGFPPELFAVQYPAPGAPELAAEIQQLLSPVQVNADRQEWGFDHGTWSILVNMYPQADIPVIQLSIDATQPASYHYQLGRKLAALRDKGVLLIASGNVVHNLRMMTNSNQHYPWVTEFNQYVIDNLKHGEDQHPLLAYTEHPAAALAHPVPDHYLPLLYTLGSWDGVEEIEILINEINLGSLSMLSFQVG